MSPTVSALLDRENDIAVYLDAEKTQVALGHFEKRKLSGEHRRVQGATLESVDDLDEGYGSACMQPSCVSACRSLKREHGEH
ncbi:hypothetical protein [Cryobacterium soli]|uniref:hypothetical protein n=1 Tax=Cryobacterium soli TaxID=2220095 RepID=UPI0013C4B232|nr:hypothetical protein [Cryobacterium soli]